ncbi:MAG TPA: transposase, partial [Lactobacillus sp.]|nr:transposase [Lactobacillus sp.]
MDLTKTVKLQIKLSNDKDAALLKSAMEHYRLACDDVSHYVFDHGFPLNAVKLQIALYGGLREQFNLKAQFAISVLRTVTARYKAVRTQLKQNPYRYQDDADKWHKQTKNLDWLWRSISFHRPQLDL